ncbi:hypothetical protein R1flu_001406 [Riccia fluitans]|uniref:F-box domain-containing protein n=1 Tax=Riccia fluitans TaxID=41844 RepID=A0ABD1Y365_9MARC
MERHGRRGWSEDGSAGGTCPSLSEDLVEKIISMMPFPSIFKARVLSKAWALKYQGKEDLGLSPFQEQVHALSSRWETFCPAVLKKDTSEVIAYCPSSNCWQKMASLAYVPGDFSTQDLITEGSLICGFVVSESSKHEHNLYVTNVLTKAYRVLPVRPNMTYIGCRHLLHRGSDGYTVVVFSLDPHFRTIDEYIFDAQVYDSKTRAWKTTKVTVENDFYMSPQCSAYVNDTLYILSRHTLGVLTSGQIGMLALNVQDMKWERYTLSFPPLNRPCTSVTLVLCAGQILVVVSLAVEPRSEWDDYDVMRLCYGNAQESLVVMRINPETRRLSVVAQGPPEGLCNGAVHNNPVTDGTYIYFGAKTSGGSVVAYNVEKDEWSKIPSFSRGGSGMNWGFQWSAFSFRPGLNPFLPV